MIVSPLPNMKTDINNNGAISTDFIGGSWDYADGNWTVREQVTEAHIQYPLLSTLYGDIFSHITNDK